MRDDEVYDLLEKLKTRLLVKNIHQLLLENEELKERLETAYEDDRFLKEKLEAMANKVDNDVKPKGRPPHTEADLRTDETVVREYLTDLLIVKNQQYEHHIREDLVHDAYDDLMQIHSLHQILAHLGRHGVEFEERDKRDDPLLEKQRETIKSQRNLLAQKEKEINLLKSTVRILEAQIEKDEV